MSQKVVSDAELLSNQSIVLAQGAENGEKKEEI